MRLVENNNVNSDIISNLVESEVENTNIKIYLCMDCNKEFEIADDKWPYGEGNCPYCLSGDISCEDENMNESVKDNYTATSIKEVLEHENDNYAIKIENRTNGKETKWLNIEGAYLFGLYHDISDIDADKYE